MLSAGQLLQGVTDSAPSVVVTLGLGLATFAFLRAIDRCKRKGAFVYPRPASTLPILGNTLDVMFYHRDRVYDYFTEQSEALGRPWQLSLLGSNSFIVVSSPEALEDLLKTHFDSFVKEEGVKAAAELFGNGIIAAAGDVWYFHRKTASHLFSHQMTRDVMYATVRRSMVTLERALRVYEARGGPVDLKAVLTHFTSDVFGKIGFGVDLDCLENGVAGKPGNEFVDAFSTASTALYRRYRQPTWLWRLKRFLNVGEEKLMRASLEVIDAFIFRVINESIAAKKRADAATDPAAPSRPTDLISLFLSSTIKKDARLKATAFDSEAQLIRDTVVNFIFAGKDSTANAMAFFVVMMNRYPAVRKRIRAELREKLPGLSNGEQLVPSLDDLAQLTYLEAAIRENLRLNTIASTTQRIATTDVVLSDGTPIPKGTRVTVALYAANRRKATWGDDALEFKPERWLDAATGKLAAVSPFKAISFLAGPRQCIGMKFAMMEMKCTLAVLLSRYDLRTVEDPWSFGYQPGTTTSVKGPLMVDIKSVANCDEAAASA